MLSAMLVLVVAQSSSEVPELYCQLHWRCTNNKFSKSMICILNKAQFLSCGIMRQNNIFKSHYFYMLGWVGVNRQNGYELEQDLSTNSHSRTEPISVTQMSILTNLVLYLLNIKSKKNNQFSWWACCDKGCMIISCACQNLFLLLESCKYITDYHQHYYFFVNIVNTGDAKKMYTHFKRC